LRPEQGVIPLVIEETEKDGLENVSK